MRKRIVSLAMLGALALVVIPVLIRSLTRGESRRYAYVRLEETEYREVRFRNEEQGLDLAGMLFVPEGEGSFPGAVIIPGSGPGYRGNVWALTLVDHMQRNGIAVLVPDKRGSGGSGGDWRSAGFPDLATDTLAALDYLQAQGMVPISGLGVIGMSQGGHIAPIVGTQAPDLDFLVNMVGGALPMHDLLVYEETHNLREMGFLPGISDILARASSWMIRTSGQREFWEAVGNFDPAPYWKEISVDSLILYGAEDTNVPSDRSAAVLDSLGNPHLSVKIYEGSGHPLEAPVGEGDSIIRLDALEEIRRFIVSRAAGRSEDGSAN